MFLPVRRLLFALSAAALVLLPLDETASAQKVTSLDRFINSKRYNAIDPAVDWWYPGGFVVVTKQGTGFFRLPDPSLVPKADSGTAVFPKQTSDSNFSLSALLTGLLSLIGGNPGIGISAKTQSDFSGVAASASLIDNTTATQLANNPKIKPQIDMWFSDKKTKVYSVLTVVSSSTLALTTSHSVEVDLSFNGSNPTKCQSNSSGGNAGSTDGSGSTASSGNGGSSGSGAGSTTTAASTGTSGAASNSSSTDPGGTAQLCLSGDKSVSISAPKSVDFAAQVALVERLPDGSYYVPPVTVVVPHIGAMAIMPGVPVVLPAYRGTPLYAVQGKDWPASDH